MTNTTQPDQPVNELRKEITVLITELGGDWYYDGQVSDPTKDIEDLADKLIELLQAECNRARIDESNFIALCCPQPDCERAIVSPRELSRVHGVLVDPPKATSVWDNCPDHSNAGDFSEPYYCDANGHEVSQTEPELQQLMKEGE